jgi:hypothetical protein
MNPSLACNSRPSTRFDWLARISDHLTVPRSLGAPGPNPPGRQTFTPWSRPHVWLPTARTCSVPTAAFHGGGPLLWPVAYGWARSAHRMALSPGPRGPFTTMSDSSLALRPSLPLTPTAGGGQVPIRNGFLSLCALVALTAAPARAETVRISDIVKDGTGAAVSDASVSLLSAQHSVVGTTRSRTSIAAFFNNGARRGLSERRGTPWPTPRTTSCSSRVRRCRKSRTSAGHRQLVLAVHGHSRLRDVPTCAAASRSLRPRSWQTSRT